MVLLIDPESKNSMGGSGRGGSSMNLTDSLSPDSFLKEDSFDFIKIEEFGSLGIDPADIAPGTFPARRHPSRLPSRFGGNAYGFGFFEICDRLNPKDLKLLQSIRSDNAELTRQYYKEINRIYQNIGLLIRFSSQGKPYYLIPAHLVLSSLSTTRIKADEISKIIAFHRKKYLKESYKIAVITHADDLIINDLSLRFREHQFVVLDSLEKLLLSKEILDLIILNRDIYELAVMEKLASPVSGLGSKKDLEDRVMFFLGRVYTLLKPEGEIFMIAPRLPLETDRRVSTTFRSEQEKKIFILFTHIFKTKERYRSRGMSLNVNVFDLQKYLNPPYVEKEVLDRVLQGRSLESMLPQDMQELPYLDFSLHDGFAYDQEKGWDRLLSVFFNKIFLKALLPKSIEDEWQKKFTADSYRPQYMLTYLGQKKPLPTTLAELKRDVMESRLSGCPLPLLADYRDSFEYVTSTLEIVKRIKSGSYSGISDLFMERLRNPLENKKRRHEGLNDVLKLISKINRIEKAKGRLSLDKTESIKTPILKNLEMLSLFGFSYGELREIFLIAVGHTPMGRILSGKMSEKALKPVSDLARAQEAPKALNLLRYCRLMSMAETAASKESDLNQEELTELFDLYESTVKVVINRETDWHQLLDEKISSMGGVHHMLVRRILKMTNHFQFLNNWSELNVKGEIEKESLADYEKKKLSEIESVVSLVKIINEYERIHFKDDPLKASIFYRKFLDIEFHGTVRIFGRLKSELVFLILWIAVHVARGDVINFNPLLAEVEGHAIDEYVRKLEEELTAINSKYLGPEELKRFSEQLYEDRSSFILGTGFQLRINEETQGIEVCHVDIGENIRELEILSTQFPKKNLSDVPPGQLEGLDQLFRDLEGFHQSYLKLISHDVKGMKLPERQKDWFRKAEVLRETLRSHFIEVIFKPENIYSDLEILHRRAPSLLQFLLPEFVSFKDIELPEETIQKTSLMEHILASTRKVQALVRKDRGSLQDVQLLHQLAQREFGPMVAGTVGLNELHIETLENIVEGLRKQPALFDAVIRSFIFRDVGLLPSLRKKYEGRFDPADHAEASAVFMETEGIALRYNQDRESERFLILLVRYHNLLHHMIRGEFSFYAIEEVLGLGDPDLFDAVFFSSFIMLYAMGEELMMEDLATRLFQMRSLCHRIISGETNPEDHLSELYARKGHAFHALAAYRRDGLPDGVHPSRYLETYQWQESKREHYLQAGMRVYALERIFRLKGIRYVEFSDLADFIIKVPLKFIYKKRNYTGIGYATFERELFEALRIYRSILKLPERARNSLFKHLVTDEVRIFGFQTVSSYLTYENMTKLLFITLCGSERLRKKGGPFSLNFLTLAEEMNKRYEAVNAELAAIPMEKISGDAETLSHFFRARSGILLRADVSHPVLTIDFIDKIHVEQKLHHMMTISEVDHLKNYFHGTLRLLRKIPFYTDDYQLKLEKAFEKRLLELSDLMIDRIKTQMEATKDFRRIQDLFQGLMEKSLEIGFTEEQRHRLNDVCELTKENLRREKLLEISLLLERLSDERELRDYWSRVKWYLLTNRPFIGKEFENLVAKRFDGTMERIKTESRKNNPLTL
jgi:hypothetical protein